MFGNYAFAGNTTTSNSASSSSTVEPSTKLISGKVIDKISGEEIAGAEIQIGEKKVYSDLNGNFSAVVSTDTRISSTRPIRLMPEAGLPMLRLKGGSNGRR